VPQKPQRPWTNIIVSRETLAMVEELQEALRRLDPLEQTPSKHRAVALAVRRMIDELSRRAEHGHPEGLDVQGRRRRRGF
jgi:Arc/MetJ family transcription regulator